MKQSASGRRVVVSAKLSMERSTEHGISAARFRGLGLTAYGRTESEAVLEVKKLFNKFIHAYREVGHLEERLNQSGEKWYWLDEYPESLPPFEDTDVLFEQWAGVPLRQPSEEEGCAVTA